MSPAPDGPAASSSPATVGRTALVLIPVAIASRGVAFLVPAVIAAWYGVGDITDAWYWALAFPTFALVLASTSLGTAATPALARVRAHAPQRLAGVLGGLITWSAVGSLSLGALICLAAGPVLPHITHFAPDTAKLASIFLWELLPFMVLTTAAAVLRVGCEVHGHFLLVAITPVLRAATVIGTTWAMLGWLGPHALPWGLVIGELVQLWFWAYILRSREGIRPRPTRHIDPEVRRVVYDLAPILGGEVLVALNLVVDKGFAANLAPGSVATLEYADRARVIPQTLLESTLLMVAYATWSNLFAAGRTQDARHSVVLSLQWVLALASPVLAGMFIGRHVLIHLLFEHGVFTSADTVATASVLGWYLPGVLPNLLGTLAVRAHVIERNLRLVLGLGLVSMVTNTALNAMLAPSMGLQGLALATTLNMLLIPTLYLVLLRRSWSRGMPPGASQRDPSHHQRPHRAGGRVHSWVYSSGLSAACLLTAVAVELGPGHPLSLTDPVLWIAAAICLTLLAVAWRTTRPSPAS